MRLHLLLALLAGTVAAAQPAAASSVTNEDKGGIRTETQERMRSGDPTEGILNWLGLLGLLGLAGLRRGHDEDSYHPSSID